MWQFLGGWQDILYPLSSFWPFSNSSGLVLHNVGWHVLPPFSSVQFSPSVISDSLQPHGLQHARLPCPSPISGACSKSCPLSWWYHLTISSSIVDLSSCLQSFPASRSFSMSQFFASVQYSGSVVSYSLWPHELQHARPSCPSPTPGVYSNSCPLSQWCHLTISSSIVPFSSCLQSFPASRSFQMSQLFTSGCQNNGIFSFNINPSNEHPGLISFRME